MKIHSMYPMGATPALFITAHKNRFSSEASFAMIDVRREISFSFVTSQTTAKAMLPLLKKTKGSRIINISSSAGLGGGAALGAYAGVSY